MNTMTVCLIVFAVISTLVLLAIMQKDKIWPIIAKFTRNKGSEGELENRMLPVSPKLTDYNTYNMPIIHRILYIVAAATIAFALGFIFYRNVYLSIFLSFSGFFYPGIRVKEIILRRKNELTFQFKEAIYALSSSLSAGKSIETAIDDAIVDLKILYPNPETMIIKEFSQISRRLRMNESAEDAIADFAKRSHVEDIQNFSDIFMICKRSGGNLVQVIRNASDIINDKIEIKQEIDTMLAQKKFEQKILNVMPVGLIFLIQLTGGDFLNPMFEKIQGIAVMSVSVALIIFAYLVSRRIMNIEV